MAGTRGGLGRIAAMVIGLAVLIFLLLAGTARAGTYDVAQCGWGVGAELDPALPRTEGVAAYLHPGYCVAPPAGVAAGIHFETGVANDGEQGIARARWAAPAGTNFAGVRFTWSSDMAYAVLELAGIDNGTGFYGLALESGVTAPTLVATPVSGPARAFEVRLECLLLGTVWGCTRSRRSTMVLSALTLTVDDPVSPGARLGGALAGGGWHRGTVPLELAAEDPAGAGVYGEAATVDGAPVLSGSVACAVATIEGAVRATRLRPCPATATQAAAVDTTAFADGTHTLRGCAVDFGGGQGCAPEVQIQVDNSAPQVEFAGAPEGQVAASVSDAFSGPAAGTIAVRRGDSDAWSDLPTTVERGGAETATLRAQLPDLDAGAYFFRATASDAAGNSASAQFRAAGSAAELRRQAAGAGGPGRGRSPAARGRTTHLVAYLAKAGDGGAQDDRALAVAGSAGQVFADRRLLQAGTTGPSPTVEGPGSAGWTLAARSFLRRRTTGSRPTVEGPGSAGQDLAARRRLRPGVTGSRLTVDYGTAVEVRGRLTDAHGTGVGGRRVAVVARSAGGGAPERRRVVTDPGGRFALRLPPGTSRRVLGSFHGGDGLAPARHRPLALRVRAAVSLAASPLRLRTGEAVTLSGRVRPGPARIPARGKLVTVQYLERASGHWRPALVVRTGARGRFKARYRFRYITGAARIRLRATALPEAGWPYAAGSSPPITVVVHGG